jgi:glycosyltransferase involved in cell wall biosynthesis
MQNALIDSTPDKYQKEVLKGKRFNTKRGLRVALIGSGPDFISTPFINTTLFLSKKGFQIDVYTERNGNFEPLAFNTSNVKVIFIPQLSYRPHRLVISLLRFGFSKKSYDFIVSFDTVGIVQSQILNISCKLHIHHSLEIFSSPSIREFKQYIKKRLEKHFMKKTTLILTQDESRARILSKINEIDIKKIWIIPNSPIGPSRPQKNDWFRRKFQIQPEQKVVLAVGSIIKEHGIKEIVEASLSWPAKFILVLHGWFPDPALRAYIEFQASRHPEKIKLSTEQLPYERKFEVFQAADIGLVFFLPLNENLRYAAGSAGKLFDFRCSGIPIIGNNIPGMKTLLEQNRSGLVVENASEISCALSVICGDYEKYRSAALAAFSKNDFQDSYEIVLELIYKKLSV